MDCGWVKLHRQLLDWEWYSDANTSRVFFHLLLTVNYETKKWRGQTIERGSRIYGLEQLAAETGLTISKLRTAINNMKTSGEIANKTTSKGSVITILNYEKYQGIDKQIANESQTDSKQTLSQIATTKEDKKIRNKEIKKELVIPDGIPLPSNLNLFIQFRKEIKKPITQSQIVGLIEDSFKLAKKSNCTPEEILQQSINKGWQGIFNLKESQNGTHKQTTGENYDKSTKSKLQRAAEAATWGVVGTQQETGTTPTGLLHLPEHIR